MQVARPVVPLNRGLGIVIGVLSYNGTISFGLSADPAIMEDLVEFRQLLEKAFRRLAKSTSASKPASTTVPRKSAPIKKKTATTRKRVASPKAKPAAARKKSPVKKKVVAKKSQVALDNSTT